MTVGIFNTRGLKNKLEEVDQLAKEVAILGISETWIRECDRKLKDSLDDSTEPPPVARMNRGYGGVRIIINPVLPFTSVRKYPSQTIQALTVRVLSIVVTTIYISPRAKRDEEKEVLEKIQKMSGGCPIVMRDLNARHTNWDYKNNPRGARLVRWANKRGWEITGPDGHSLVTTRGANSPDIVLVLTKGVETQRGIVLPKIRDGGSDHAPVKFKYKWKIGNQRTPVW